MDNLMSLPALDFFPHRLIVLEYQPTTPYSKAFFYFGVFIITWCFWKVFLYPQWLSPLRDMSGPTGNHFLFGQSKRLLNEPPAELMLEWMDDISNSGFIRYLSFLNTEFLLVTSPKALNTICNQQVYNFVKTPLIRALINKAAGTGVFYAEGEQHKHERHALQPAFSFRRIKSLYPLFWSKAVELRDTLDTHVLQLHKAADGSDRPSSIIDASSWFSRATLDLLGIAVFDYDFGSVQNPDHALFHSTASYHTAQRSQLAGPLRFFLNQLLPEFVTRHVPFLSYGDFQKSADPARTYFRSLLDKRREDVSAGKDFGQDLLTMMLKRGDFSDEDMVHQMMTMWFAGTQSTAAELTWAIYNLCRNPSAQLRLRDELYASLPSDPSPRSIDAKMIDELPYLSAVCNETLRLYPAFPLLVRENLQPTTLEGVYLPAHTQVALAPGAINRSKEIWGPDAREFKPERWICPSGRIDKSGGARDASNWNLLTFLHGPRSCIGQTQARAEIACVLAVMVMNFEWSLDDPTFRVTPKGGVVSRPAGGLHVRCKMLSSQG